MSIENRFEWSDGSGSVSATGAGDSFSAWSEGEPNAWGPPGSEGDGSPGHPESVEDAIQLFHINDKNLLPGSWNDADGSRLNSFVCGTTDRGACVSAGDCTYTPASTSVVVREAGCFSAAAEYCGGLDLTGWAAARQCSAERGGPELAGRRRLVLGGLLGRQLLRRLYPRRRCDTTAQQHHAIRGESNTVRAQRARSSWVEQTLLPAGSLD